MEGPPQRGARSSRAGRVAASLRRGCRRVDRHPGIVNGCESRSTAPLDAAHACAHVVCRATRNLTDRQLDAIRESRGMVGFNFSVCDARPDVRLEENTPIDTVVQHLIYLEDRLGEDHVGLGPDSDGAVMPRAMRDAGCFPNLIHSLREHGFNEDTLRKIAFDNWMRVFQLVPAWRTLGIAGEFAVAVRRRQADTDRCLLHALGCPIFQVMC
jgi:hypothetical protein